MPTSTTHLRLIHSGDLPAALALSTMAGWNQTFEDWKMLLDLAPEACFGIESDGQLVSTTTLVCYGRRLGWIGMVLTRPEYRGRGFARKLLTHVVNYADAIGIATLKLDATDQGRALYENLGFRQEQAVERWSRPGSAGSPHFYGLPEFQSTDGLDLAATGVDRSALLAQLAKRSEVYRHAKACLFTRVGRTSAYMGPCVAADAGQVRSVVAQALDTAPGAAWSWDLLTRNEIALTMATELGFTRQRLLTRMARGKPLSGRDDMVFAIAGLELG